MGTAGGFMQGGGGFQGGITSVVRAMRMSVNLRSERTVRTILGEHCPFRSDGGGSKS